MEDDLNSEIKKMVASEKALAETANLLANFYKQLREAGLSDETALEMVRIFVNKAVI